MFGIFGGKKGKKGGKPPVSGKNPGAGAASQPQTREQIIAEAHANARKAREEIGSENLNRMMEAILREGKSPGGKARAQIREMDKGRVADQVKLMLEDEED